MSATGWTRMVSDSTSRRRATRTEIKSWSKEKLTNGECYRKAAGKCR